MEEESEAVFNLKLQVEQLQVLDGAFSIIPRHIRSVVRYNWGRNMSWKPCVPSNPGCDRRRLRFWPAGRMRLSWWRSSWRRRRKGG